MDSWDMVCAFLERIMRFGDKALYLSWDEYVEFQKIECEIINASNNGILNMSHKNVVLNFYYLVQRRIKEKAMIFSNGKEDK